MCLEVFPGDSWSDAALLLAELKCIYWAFMHHLIQSFPAEQQKSFFFPTNFFGGFELVKEILSWWSWM